MFRSLHMKLVLIMVLLIVSLMTVIGAFLINSVSSFYLNDFYTQMQEVFADPDLYYDMTTPAEEETDGTESLKRVMDAYVGVMGVDGRNRNYYILDGVTGKYLAGSDDEGGPLLDKTPNMVFALTRGQAGSQSDITASYMDVAVPITRGEQNYIIYLYDNRSTIQTLNSQLVVLIVQALVFGLVISVLLSFLLAKTMITPIERLTAGARRVAEGDFSNKIEVGSKDEIGVLTNTFNNMARQLREKEQNEVKLWSFAMSKMGEMGPENQVLRQIINANTNIPFVITTGTLDVVTSHLIPERILTNPALLRQKCVEMAAINQYWEIKTWSNDTYYLFYGESNLLRTLVYFPYIQLAIICIFAMFGYITFRSSKQDEQNRVWIGLAKETAHQLGTPTSSLFGWIEYLRTQPIDQTAVEEMNKDVVRLTKVVDRFSKIGSTTSLSEGVINEIVGGSVLYFRTRVPRNVTINYNGLAMAQLKALVNEALFEWVIENLLKNALDALSGVGSIDVKLSSDNDWIYIDVKDTGKGMPKSNFKRIFEPGFTTKTRGWGLGLSLSKRIIEGYHNGRIFVLNSEIDQGTTIRIMLKKLYS